MSQRSIFRRHRQVASTEEAGGEEQTPETPTTPPPESFRHPPSPASPTLMAEVAGGAVDILRSKLRSLRLTELLRRAEDAGVDPDALDEAAEAPAEPKEAIVGLIVQQLVPSLGGVLAHALTDADKRDAYDEAHNDRYPITVQHESEPEENSNVDDSQAWGHWQSTAEERRQSLVDTMMRQFAADLHGDDHGNDQYASDEELSDNSLESGSDTSTRPLPVARRQRMTELSQPLPRHQQTCTRHKQDSPAWRPGGAAVPAAKSRPDQDACWPRTVGRKAKTGGGSDSWHVAECAARSAKQRLAQRRKAQTKSTAIETHCAFGSSTNRNVTTSTTNRRVPSHVLVTPPRPELTEPRRGIRSTPSACRAQEQRAFGSALSTHRGVPGGASLPWQRRNSQPSLSTESIDSATDGRGSHLSARRQTTGKPKPVATELEVADAVSSAKTSVALTLTPPTLAAAPDTVKVLSHARGPASGIRPNGQASTKRQRRRRFLRALCDVQAGSEDGLSFREGDLVILLAKPQVTIWMGYVHGARSKVGKFPASAVKTMRSVCVAADILPGTFITVALPKQSGTIEVLLPLGAKSGSDVVFPLPSEASSLTKSESDGAVRVAGEEVLPEDQEKQLGLHLLQVARDNETKLSDTPQESRPPEVEVPLSNVGTSAPSSGLLTVKVLQLRRMKNGVLKKDDLPLRLLVGHTEKRVDGDDEASFMIREDASLAKMLVVLEDGSGPAQASIDLGSAVRSSLSRSWHTLYCDSTEQKNQFLLHLELRFDSEAKITDAANVIDDSVHLQRGDKISLDQTEQDTDLLEQDATIAALEDFCDNVDAASVLCLTGPQGGGKQHLVEAFMNGWKNKLKDEAEAQSPALFICHVEMGSACVTSPRKFLLQLCTEMIRIQPSLLPCDLTGDVKTLVETWVGLLHRLVAICGRVVFALCGMDRMLKVPGSWFPKDLPRGVKMILPVTIWLPSDITCQVCEELELPALKRSASKRLIQELQAGAQLETTVEDSILAHSAVSSPLFVVLSCRVSAALQAGADITRTCRSVDELFGHCVQLAEGQIGRSLDTFLSLVALGLSVGAPLRSVELEALVQDIESQVRSADKLPAQSPKDAIFRVADLESTALGCFITKRSDGGVMLCHDVIVAEVCNMYSLLPASPDEAASADSGARKATELHKTIGDAFHLQLHREANDFKSLRSPASQTASKAQIVRAAEIAVIHCMCAGKWSAAWECVVALQGIRPLRTVCNALTLTVDDLSSIIDGAVRGLAEAKEVLEQNRSQCHHHMSLRASA